jgi:hypothetical protein
MEDKPCARAEVWRWDSCYDGFSDLVDYHVILAEDFIKSNIK